MVYNNKFKAETEDKAMRREVHDLVENHLASIDLKSS